MRKTTRTYETRGYWIQENLQYAEPNFRLRKCARLVNELTQGKTCDLLDVGCGPAALRGLLGSNVRYHGIDLAIQSPEPYLREADFLKNPIAYQAKRFDIVVALGVFEYMGLHQFRKFSEISKLLNPGGRFLMSYINFGHFRRKIYPAYNNIQSITDMIQNLGEVFYLEKVFPVSHHWRHKQPGKNAIPAIQMRLDINIPGVSPWLAVEYFFLCAASLPPQRSMSSTEN